MWAIAKLSVWQAKHTVAIGELTKFVPFATVVLAAVGAPFASTAKPAPKATSRGARVAGANWKALVEADASVPVTTALYWRLFGEGMVDPAAL